MKKDTMFIPCSEKIGTAYFEFQYCKQDWDIKKLLKKGYSYWEQDSLLVSICDDKEFFEDYGDCLSSPHTPDGTCEFNYYGVNYYTKEQALSMLETLKRDAPKDSEILVEWLEKAVTEYNGFFFLGI